MVGSSMTPAPSARRRPESASACPLARVTTICLPNSGNCSYQFIEIQPAPDYTPLDRAISNLHSYDWLIFTSANGVRYFLERLDASSTDLRSLGARICAIGPATRAAVEAVHLKVDLMGREYVAEGLLDAFATHDLAGKRVLLPRSEEHTSELQSL